MGYGVFIAAIGPAFRSAVWLCALFTATSMMRFEPVSTSTDPADVAMMQARADPTLGAWMIVKHINLIVSFCLLYQCIALGIAVGLGVSYKWALMGQRKEGSWNWDSSKYNRNWKFYTAVTFIDLGAIGGSAYIVWWYRLLGCKIGKDVCLWPAGSDLYLTEPDLVELDEGVCLNKKAGVVCHLNSRGGFSLTAIRMGARRADRFARSPAGRGWVTTRCCSSTLCSCRERSSAMGRQGKAGSHWSTKWPRMTMGGRDCGLNVRVGCAFIGRECAH